MQAGLVLVHFIPGGVMEGGWECMARVWGVAGAPPDPKPLFARGAERTDDRPLRLAKAPFMGGEGNRNRDDVWRFILGILATIHSQPPCAEFGFLYGNFEIFERQRKTRKAQTNVVIEDTFRSGLILGAFPLP